MVELEMRRLARALPPPAIPPDRALPPARLAVAPSSSCKSSGGDRCPLRRQLLPSAYHRRQLSPEFATDPPALPHSTWNHQSIRCRPTSSSSLLKLSPPKATPACNNKLREHDEVAAGNNDGSGAGARTGRLQRLLLSGSHCWRTSAVEDRNPLDHLRDRPGRLHRRAATPPRPAGTGPRLGAIGYSNPKPSRDDCMGLFPC